MAAGAKDRLEFILSLTDRISKPLRTIRGRIGALSDQVSVATRRMQSGFILGAGALFGLVGAIGPALQFERAMARMAAAGGRSAEELERVRSAAMRINAELGSGLPRVADALEQARRLTGATGDALERTTRNALVLTEVFPDLDQTQLFGAQATLAREFGLAVDEGADAIAALLRHGGDLRGELLESIREYAVQFRGLGFDVRQTVSLTQRALDRGWSVDKMLDAVKEGGIKIRELGADQVRALGTLGLEDLVPRIRAGEVAIADVMGTIGRRAAALENETARFNVLAALFGAPAEDVGVQPMLAMLRAIEESPQIAGAMDEIADRFTATPAARLQALVGKVQNLATAFGSTLLPVLGPTLDRLNEGFEVAQRWTRMFPNLTRVVGVFTTAVLGLALGLAAAKILFGALTLLMVPFKAAVMAVRGALLLAKTATLLFNAALWANPITWIVALIIGLVVAIVLAIKHWDRLKAAAGAAADWIGQKWEWLVGMIDQGITALRETVVGWIDAAWEKLKAFGRWIGEGFMELIQPLLDLGGFLGNLLGFGGEGGAEGASLAQRGTRGETAGREVRQALANAASQDNRRTQVNNVVVKTEKFDAHEFERQMGLLAMN